MDEKLVHSTHKAWTREYKPAALSWHKVPVSHKPLWLQEEIQNYYCDKKQASFGQADTDGGGSQILTLLWPKSLLIAVMFLHDLGMYNLGRW